LRKSSEIGPYFRAEESHTGRHVSEFTSVDIEQAFADMDDVMQLLEDAVVYVVKNVIDVNGRELKI
jgi:nondiscriminating aspartyl-tRNA synthetase